jgi:glycosyltransferase involved in cell wall biosynthesis
MHKVSFSVIIPVFNRFNYTDRAILSVLRQSVSDWELIVVDDHSSEPYVLPHECKNYHQKILLIRNNTNLGPGRSRQVGMDNSSGQYICFLDSDDYYHPDFLFRSLEAHSYKPEISASYCISQNIRSGQIREFSDFPHRNLVPVLFDNNRPWATCTLLWNRNFVSKWSGLRTNQDALFELECALVNNRIAHIPHTLAYIDTDTGMNTADLVKKNDIIKDENYVVMFALKNNQKFHIDNIDISALEKSMYSRLLHVSSKLAVSGLGFDLIRNSILILRNKKYKLSVTMLLSGILTFFPSSTLRLYCSEIISNLNYE